MTEPRVLPQPALGAPPRLRVPHAERYALDNGLRVIAAPAEGLPQVVLRLVVPAGSAADPREYRGTASLVGHLLVEGSAALPAQALHERLDGLGAAVHPQAGHDFAELEVVLLSETLAEGIELMAEILTRPAFPSDQVERIREETLDAIQARLDEPGQVADDLAMLEVFGAEHPYGIPAFGTEAGIRAVPREALQAFHAAHYRPQGAFLVASGEFDPGELRAALGAGLAGWSGVAPPLSYPCTPPLSGKRLVHPWKDAAQSEIRIAGPGMHRLDPDWVRAGVTNFLLGGSTITGRLGANLREDKGWTYGARSAFSAGIVPGGWVAETAVDVEVTGAALGEMVKELQRLLDEAVDEGELSRARDALMLSLPRAFETPAGVASRLATVEAYGLPHDWWERFAGEVEAVTPDDVRRMARAHFDPARLVQVVVGGGVS